MVWLGVIPRAERRMQILTKIVAEGELRLLLAEVGAISGHVENLYKQQGKLTQSMCDELSPYWRGADGLYAVMAIGDAEGNSVCTVNESIVETLPTMNDRQYYQDAKNAQSLVVGEYAVSKTTGKPVLHLAYPLVNTQGKFEGLFMMGLDLNWFVSRELSQLLSGSRVVLTVVDDQGKTLFTYPGDEEDIGDNALSGELISMILSGEGTPQLVRGYDSKYRVYAYQWVEEAGTKLAVVSGVVMSDYLQLLMIGVVFGGLVGWGVEYALRHKQ